MDRLKPFIGRYLHASKISYIMGFQEFIEIEDMLADLDSEITDLDDLGKDIKKNNQDTNV